MSFWEEGMCAIGRVVASLAGTRNTSRLNYHFINVHI